MSTIPPPRKGKSNRDTIQAVKGYVENEPAPGGRQGEEEARRFMARFDRAKSRRDQMSSTIDACYEFALPLRQRAYMGRNVQQQTDRVFDATAVTAVQGLASQTLDDVWPADQTPFELRAGPDAPDPDAANKIAAEWAERIIAIVNNSEFRSAAHEMFLDYCIGTGVMLVEPGDALRPVLFRAVPLTECVLDVGPRGDVDALFIPREVEGGHVRALWPRANLPAELVRRIEVHPAEKFRFVEGVERDWSARNREVWVSRVVWGGFGGGEVIQEDRDEGAGSCPFLAPSFTRVAGEALGRGPVMLALPDIRTANKLVELMLERADLELSGIWLYDDDGVLNPDTMAVEPGALIPRAPNSRGLENLAPSGSGMTAERLLEQLHARIKEGLYVNDLGDITKTPKSATEIMQRTSDRARRLAGSYGRLLTEFLFPLVSRVWWILRGQLGAREKLPAIDNDRLKVRPLSPLVRAQAQDEILRTTNYLQTIQAFFGPQAAMLITDQDKLSKHLANLMGFNPNLLRSKAEQDALLQQGMQLAEQAGMLPQAAQAMAEGA